MQFVDLAHQLLSRIRKILGFHHGGQHKTKQNMMNRPEEATAGHITGVECLSPGGIRNFLIPPALTEALGPNLSDLSDLSAIFD